MSGSRQDFRAEAIAQLLGVTTRRLQQLAAEGYIPKGNERGTYPLVGSVQGYIRYLKESSRESNRSSEHQRLARAQAVKVEMENYRRAGESILREDVHELLATIMNTLVAELEGIPGRTAGEFAAIDDAAEIRRRQQDECRAVRSVIADALEKFAEHREDLADSGAGDAAAHAANAEPVGGSVSIPSED